MSQLKGATVLVVGGTSGIGLATAREAARRGAHVQVAGLGASSAGESLGGDVAAHELDITDEAQIAEVLGTVGALDHLVVTAGAGRYGPLRDLTRDEARSFLDIKLWGQYSVIRAASDQFRPAGSIVLLSGIASRRPFVGGSVMSATNAAVEAFGRALALELAPLRVNVVAPGLTQTPIYAGMPDEDRDAMYAGWSASVPAGRAGTPDEIADAVLYLLTNEFITGSVLAVDGGGLLA